MLDILRVTDIIPYPQPNDFESITTLVDYLRVACLATNQMDLISQFLVLWVVITLGATVFYYSLCSLSYLVYFVIFRNFFHPPHEPQPFKGQVALEALMSLIAIPGLALLTVPFLQGELHGYSQLYWEAENDPWWYYVIVTIGFILFTDTGIYWIHRWEHTFPLIYKYVHKPHHKWLVTTPFAAFAFHPVDGWAQALPYHFYVYLVPMQTKLYLFLFIAVQCWSISIHDGIDAVGSRVSWWPSKVVNGSLHHFIHHSRFDYNYGQYFTFWDWFMGSHYDPKPDFDSGDFNLPKQNYHPGMHPSELTKKQQ
ncbi:hypothetical protein ABK040_005941 [Willaertia magna]